MRESVHICLDIARQGPMAKLIEQLVDPTEADLASDDALDDWMLRNVRTSHHISGTCKMGPDSDRMAVVDQRGRGLRTSGPASSRRLDNARLHTRQHQRHLHNDRRARVGLHHRRRLTHPFRWPLRPACPPPHGSSTTRTAPHWDRSTTASPPRSAPESHPAKSSPSKRCAPPAPCAATG